MIKFKTLFRKGHHSGGSGGGGDRVKNKHSTPQPTAVTGKADNFDPLPNDTINADRHREKTVTNASKSDKTVTTTARMVDSNAVTVAAISELDYENIRQRLRQTSHDKANLESTLQELINSHGELETIRKEIETLKVSIGVLSSKRKSLFALHFAVELCQEQRNEIQNSILLRIGKVDIPAVETAGKNGLGRGKKLPNSAPASIAPPTDSTVGVLNWNTFA